MADGAVQRPEEAAQLNLERLQAAEETGFQWFRCLTPQ